MLVERQGFAFFMDLSYDNLPEFYSHCMTISHHINFCKIFHVVEGELEPKPTMIKEATRPKPGKSIFVKVRDGRKFDSTKVDSVDSSKLDGK